MNPARRIPSLDGLRAISIALVILSHLVAAGGVSLQVSALDQLELGQLGVRVFFVISGFLITGLLNTEMKRTGTVDIRHFYMRRTLRIFPAYFVFLGATAMAALLGIISVSWPQLRQAFLYLSNYAVLTTSRPYLDQPLGHTWSLAVEEQFYLLWPTVLLLVGLRRARWVTAAAFLLSPAIMLIEKRSPTMHNGLGVTFETIAYALAAGCFLALIWEDLPRSPLFRRFSELRWSVTLLLPVLALPLFIERARTHSSIVEDLWPFVGPMLTLVITGLLAWCVVNYDTGLGRLLNSRPLLYVGGLSYSLYLWQQPFLLGHDFGGVAQRFPLNVGLALLFGLASYYFVERPVLRWRDRSFERRRAVVAPSTS